MAVFYARGGGGGTRLIWWTGCAAEMGDFFHTKKIPKHAPHFCRKKKIPKHAPHFCREKKSLNMPPPTFVILL